jgi:hypothetical protein
LRPTVTASNVKLSTQRPTDDPIQRRSGSSGSARPSVHIRRMKWSYSKICSIAFGVWMNSKGYGWKYTRGTPGG